MAAANELRMEFGQDSVALVQVTSPDVLYQVDIRLFLRLALCSAQSSDLFFFLIVYLSMCRAIKALGAMECLTSELSLRMCLVRR